MVGMMGAGG